MAGVVGVNQVIPRMRRLQTNNVISSSGGINPVDVSPVTLKNMRGQLAVQGVASDTGVIWSFDIQGGFGDYLQEIQRNFYFLTGTNVNCTVNTLAVNRLEIITPVGDAGGRRYIMQFQPLPSFGPTIHQTSVNVLGAADLTVTMTKYLVIPG